LSASLRSRFPLFQQNASLLDLLSNDLGRTSVLSFFGSSSQIHNFLHPFRTHLHGHAEGDVTVSYPPSRGLHRPRPIIPDVMLTRTPPIHSAVVQPAIFRSPSDPFREAIEMLVRICFSARKFRATIFCLPDLADTGTSVSPCSPSTKASTEEPDREGFCNSPAET